MLTQIREKSGDLPHRAVARSPQITIILRLARASENEIVIWTGHERAHLRATGEYGEWDPDYLANAAAAIDAWFARMQALAEHTLFSRGFPKPSVYRWKSPASY